MNRLSSIISRADLLRLQVHQREAEAVLLARQLGLELDRNYWKQVEENTSWRLEVLPTEKGVEESLFVQEPPNSVKTPSPVPVAHSTQHNPLFWYLAKRDWHDEQDDDEVEQDSQAFSPPEAWRNRPAPAEHTPLYTEQALSTQLLPLLRQLESGRKVDLKQVVKILSRAELLRSLPHESRQTKQVPLIIVVDRSRHLAPYWQDQMRVIEMLMQLGYPASQLAVWVEGEALPRRVTEDGLQTWQVAQGAVVVALTDLGALQQQGRQEQIWASFGRLLQRQHNQVIALLPCGREWVNPALGRLFQSVSVERECYLVDETLIQAQAEQLLTALAPCIRLEPSLLRDMRLSMAKLGEQWQIPAAIESRVWQHSALAESNSVAASWNSEVRKAYLQRFEGLSEDEKSTALMTIRRWRGKVSENIWYEELLSLSAETQNLEVIRDDAQQGFDKLRFIVGMGRRGKIAHELASYYRRMEQRLPEEQVSNFKELQNLVEVFGVKQQLVDPQHLMRRGEKQQGLLYQRGNKLFLCPFEPFKPSKEGMSPLCIVTLRRAQVQVCDAAGRGLGVLSLAGEGGFELEGHSALQVRSDVEVMYLETRRAPVGSEMGRDGYGLYVDLTFFGVVQRFRYITPGRFWMGSPKSDLGRSNETLHEVTLTTGFWLADTTCTQTLWKAVMGNNPAHFKGNIQQPVEKVSWLDAQEFLHKLRQTYSELTLGLPTEAQWEYACRAGTATPFSFGANITPVQVNYDGHYPYADGVKGERRAKTIAVKHLAANPWGLYEMHGNVWEWCVDKYRKDLGTASVINPVRAQTIPAWKAEKSLEQTGIIVFTLAPADDASGQRVVRGGSWDDLGWGCRSAFRYSYSPSSNNYLVGFRFALGDEMLSPSLPEVGGSEKDE